MSNTQLSQIKSQLTQKEADALKEAISVIWLNDRSDYINGLWDVIRAIIGHDIVSNDDISTDQLYKAFVPQEDE